MRDSTFLAGKWPCDINQVRLLSVLAQRMDQEVRCWYWRAGSCSDRGGREGEGPRVG